jgi:hypothetical protein
VIGGTTPENVNGVVTLQEGNLISGNQGNGITMTDLSRTNFVAGNFIGTTVTGKTSRTDTSFAGVTDEVTDEEVITAIRSVPCHYTALKTRGSRLPRPTESPDAPGL